MDWEVISKSEVGFCIIAARSVSYSTAQLVNSTLDLILVDGMDGIDTNVDFNDIAQNH